MAAETISIGALPALQLLARLRASTSTDNLLRAGETGAPTTSTITFVYTPGANPSASTLTCNVVAVGP